MKPKRVNEVVYVAVLKSSGQPFMPTIRRRAYSTKAIINQNEGKVYYRIAKCRLVEIPKKKRKVKK